jgi:murein DD-endopeptidase MepM/ murein hydrolase activator NlpD
MSRGKLVRKVAKVVGIMVAVVLVWTQWTVHRLRKDPYADKPQVDPAAVILDKRVTIPPGSTYRAVMAAAGVPDKIATAMYNAAHDIYDLANIRAGRDLEVETDLSEEHITGLTYQVDSEQELKVEEKDGEWKAELVLIDYTVEVRTVEGVIDTSMYASGLAQGLDEATIVTIAEPFQWSVDFALDIRKGDTYKVIYEARYRDGVYVMPGRVLAGKFVNDGVTHYAFLYENAKGETGHYDENGNSVQKMFLKAPVAFKYITSGFTTGKRYVSEFNVSTGHRAIDYAAPTGTPIRAVGDGTVVFAGWGGPYGNKTSIRHNGTYSTNYCHQSRFAVKVGQHVTQGQIIGYVGTTGFSTGPHLHFEMVKNGVKINPLKEILPPGPPIADADRPAFDAFVAEHKAKLDE